ncbi:uncharacterized protein LOC111924202 isoform X2 [Cyanistes caeruleus]|uniref:uncharacterized protein LOC111924202 isoform X2 n=1 Tax=Cyanistes caeruleus TaxID=156563 RepID=UPI000CDB92FB|nr:uncharacterized protein LOC111924202 isoform X2 [Cyanistes caeruleus]
MSFFFSKWLTSVFQGYCFPSPRLNTVSSRSMEFVWKRWWYLQLSCILIMNLVYANLEYQKETPPSLLEIDHQCWEASSHGLVEMKKLKGLLSPIHFRPEGEKMKILKQGNIKMKEHKITIYIVGVWTNSLA